MDENKTASIEAARSGKTDSIEVVKRGTIASIQAVTKRTTASIEAVSRAETDCIESVCGNKTASIEAVRRVAVTRRTPQQGSSPAADQARHTSAPASPEEPAAPLASPFRGKYPVRTPGDGGAEVGYTPESVPCVESNNSRYAACEVRPWQLSAPGAPSAAAHAAPASPEGEAFREPALASPFRGKYPEGGMGAPESDTRQAPPPAPTPSPDLRSHFARLCAEGEALHRADPDFDLAAALRDPDFLRLTAPGVGVPAADAWYALHRREYTETLRRTSLEQAAAAVAAGRLRPREGGRSSGGELLGTDARHMSPAQRADLRERIKRGEKVYPR